MRPIQFAAAVEVDGTDIAGIVLAGATIHRGGTNPDDPVAPPGTAHLELISYDAAGDLVVDYPEFTFGDGVPSGFVPVYGDRYEGGESKLTPGRPVTIRTVSPSGFEPTYFDDYATGYESTRFVGYVTAIDYTPALIAITAVTVGEYFNRTTVNPAGWPAEPDVDRVARIAAAAGATIDVRGTSTARVAAEPVDADPVPAVDLLADVAHAGDGLFYVTRDGQATYLTNAYTGGASVTLPPGATLVDDLRMTRELGTIVNHVEVESAEGPIASARDLDSITAYGLREYQTKITGTGDDAQAKADRMIAARAWSTWFMPAITLNLNLARTEGEYPDNLGDLLNLDLDDQVTVPSLLPGSPEPSYTSRVLGSTETLDPYQWSITYNLAQNGWRL